MTRFPLGKHHRRDTFSRLKAWHGQDLVRHSGVLCDQNVTKQRFRLLDAGPKTCKTPGQSGAQGGNRTHDLRITSALLYRLSYLGAACIVAAASWG